MGNALVPVNRALARRILAPRPVLGSRAPDAVTLGRLVDPVAGIRGKMCYGGAQHLIAFGPNGKGKGTRILMPNLLQMSGASVVGRRSEGRAGRRHRALSGARWGAW